MNSRLLGIIPQTTRLVSAFRSSRVLARGYASNSSNTTKIVPSYLLNTPIAKVTRLPNGIRVVTEEYPGETATVGVWVGAGSVYETEKNNGVAHFLEHLAFKGTSTRTQSGIELEVENMGAQLNAYTSREQTVYFAKTIKNNIAPSVEIIADIIQNPKLADEKIEAERSTILTEAHEVEKNTEEVIFDHLHAAAYQGTALGRNILGSEQNIKTISRKDLVDYIGQYYTGPRMVVAGAGAVKHEELVSLVEKNFTSIAKEDKVGQNIRDVPSQFTGSEIKIRNDDMPLAHIAIAIEAVGWTHPDYFVMLVIQTLLGSWDRTIGGGNNLSSRLCELVATEELCHSLSTFNTCYGNTALFGNYIVAQPGRLDDIVFEVLNEWQRLATGPVTSEVDRAKAKLKAGILMQLDGTTAICENLGRQMLNVGRVLPPAEVFLRIDQITPADVARVASTYMNDVSPAVVAMGPIEFFPDYNQIRSWTYWNRT